VKIKKPAVSENGAAIVFGEFLPFHGIVARHGVILLRVSRVTRLLAQLRKAAHADDSLEGEVSVAGQVPRSCGA
jgi:hypothetical protein